MNYKEHCQAQAVMLNWNSIDNVTNAIVDECVQLLKELRQEKNYAVADRLRNCLMANCVAISYQKDGEIAWHWSPKRG